MSTSGGPGNLAPGGDSFTCISKVSLSCISAWKRLHSSLCCSCDLQAH